MSLASEFRVNRFVTEGGVDLLAHSAFDIWGLAKEIERPGQRKRRRFVAGGDEGQEIVGDLHIGHPAPAVIGRHQEGQEVVMRGVAGAPFRENAGELCAHIAPRGARLARSGMRQPCRRTEEPKRYLPAERL